ncbi:MAG: choice-of-anchor R domain-containing protein [Terriglobia bacterium]
MMMNTGFRKKMFVVCLSAFVLGLAAAGAKADTIFTNLGTGGTFNTSYSYTAGGANYSGQALGMQFTASATADLTDAMLALGFVQTSNSPITVYLESDSSGNPGSTLATLTQQGTIPSFLSPALVTFDCSAACPTLDSGTAYWLVAVETDPNSQQQWSLSTADTGTTAVNTSTSATGPWSVHPEDKISAFDVNGTPVTTTATPEPASLLLFGTGLLGAAILVRRREKHRAAGE